jgi:hypothetical protein
MTTDSGSLLEEKAAANVSPADGLKRQRERSGRLVVKLAILHAAGPGFATGPVKPVLPQGSVPK